MEQKTQLAPRLVKTSAPRRLGENGAALRTGSSPRASDGDIRVAPEAIADPAPTRGRVEVVETYFDPDGRPMKRKSLGAARVARFYDAKGNQVEEAYFNAEGKPTVRKDLGAARISWRYDDSGKQVEAALFGADGAPLPRTRGRKGVRQRLRPGSKRSRSLPWASARPRREAYLTRAIRKPSHPLEPTVCTAVASTRGSRGDGVKQRARARARRRLSSMGRRPRPRARHCRR